MSHDGNRDDKDLLGDLRAVTPPRELVDRVRRQAHAELERGASGGFFALAVRAWTQVGLPAALTVTVVGYLAWAVNVTGALYR